jgi:uncharacterized protein (DUF885 family)
VKNILFVLLLVLTGCARLSPTTASNAEAEFNRLAEDYLTGYLAWRPQTGVGLGFHEYDGKPTDLSRRSLDAELERLKSIEKRLAALDSARLEPRVRRDYRILRGAIQREIFGFEEMQVFRLNPMTYAGALDVNLYIKRNYAPLEDRLPFIIATLQNVPQIRAAARANLADTLPRPQIETAISQATGAADFLSQDLVTSLKPVQSHPRMAEFEAANRQAIAEYQAYANYLKEQKLPKATDHFALGRKRYVRMLQIGEMISVSPEQILEVGLREMRHQQEVFAAAASQIAPGKPPIEVFKSIQHDHPTAQNLISDTAKDMEMIRQFLVDHHIITLPSPVRAQVKEMPQYLRATGFASMDTPGPFETKATEAYYYVTPPESSWSAQQQEEWLTAFNYYTTDVVSIHEAYPGHYVQFLCLNASSANKLEKIFNSYAFIEGWAHYTEQMMLDEGFGNDNPAAPTPEQAIKAAKYRMAQADEALLRLCRLCVSIQMHCQGMTIDQGTRFFQDNCYYEAKTAHQEAVRGAFDPEYLYYTLGKLEILKLREDFRRQEGAAYSLQRFHDEMLSHGAPPIRLLREVLLKDAAAWEQVL